MPANSRVQMSAEERAQKEIQDEIERYSDLIAADLGPAPGARSASDAERVEMWGRRDPKVQFDQVKEILMTTGFEPFPEALDPNHEAALGLVKAHPEMAQVLAAPLDETMATMMATLCEFPLRLSTLAQYEDDPEAMTREAERIDAQWMKRVAARAEGTWSSGVDASGPASTTLGYDEQPMAAGMPAALPMGG